MKKSAEKAKDAQIVRAKLQELMKRHSEKPAAKAALLSETGISNALFEKMAYHGLGGMDSWILAVKHIASSNPKAAIGILGGLGSSSQETQLPESERTLIKTIKSLPEDRQIFWSQVIDFAENIEKSIGGQKAKRSRKSKK